MSRYIDAEKLKRSIEAQCRVLRAIGIGELTEMTDVLSAGFIQEIENAPTEDVVKVVRCEECDNWNPMTHGCVRNPFVKPWWEDDYCSYWEKKENE